MSGSEVAGPPVRRRGADRNRVTYMELFFDVVYVLAVTELTGVFVREPTLLGAVRALLLLIALWWTWVDTAWITNWLDPDHLAVRLMLVGLMLCSLLISATLSGSFAGRALGFAGAYVALNVGRYVFCLVSARRRTALWYSFERALVWRLFGGAFWLAGGFVHGWPRLALWLAGLVVDTVAAAWGFYLPKLGRAQPGDWPLSGPHLAERCYLFVILALGESILAAGTSLAQHKVTTASVAALVAALLNSVALWWIYFDRSATRASGVIAGSPNPARLGRSAYTYVHLPIIAGIILTSVGDELALERKSGPATVAAVLGGPALFLAGHLLFRLAVFGELSVSRLVAILALGALTPVGLLRQPVLLMVVASPVLLALVVWESMAVRGVPPGARPSRRVDPAAG